MKLPHIEKILLLLSIIGLFLVSLFFTTKTIDIPGSSVDELNDKSIFTVKNKSQKQYLLFDKEISLMPGEKVFYKETTSEKWLYANVLEVLLPTRSNISVLTNAMFSKGIIRSEISIRDNWSSLQGGFTLKTKSESILVPYSDMKRVYGKLWLLLDTDPEEITEIDSDISFYQKNSIASLPIENSGKTKWTNTISETNASVYDLFTPPIIYMHDGDLTTRIPEKKIVEQELEPFGLSLVKVSKAEYPLTLKSWAGKTPYFEEVLINQESGTSERIRNRVEVGQIYKRSLSRQSGEPSLVPCDSNDSSKIFIVEHFVVQQYRNPETGGLRKVGRAMIRDFTLGGPPFEINTLMKKVYAGNYTFLFNADLPSLKSEEFSFESSQGVATFDYGGRIYKIIDISTDNQTITVVKSDPRILEDSSKTFSF